MKCTKCNTVNRVPIQPQKSYKNKEEFKNQSYQANVDNNREVNAEKYEQSSEYEHEIVKK